MHSSVTFHINILGESLTLSAPKAIFGFFANNTDSGESARNELSHLKSALFAFELSKLSKIVLYEKMETPDFEHGRVYFKQFGAERVKKKNY